ncbi:cation:proton antiporter [Sphingomonas montanisoli]|uniref:Sodium:proton antiporter n=1 Tax=Sphingomonas montanisoli TaxID=2606412 RepID=A0A5D9C3F9_9SPHN|nr:cation:proton antiporter [Sphingomonas montanisoli]TZG25822.1 sodium:proton antiporter [Sphingomonas montanisoli]
MYGFSPYHIALALLGLGVILAYWLPRFVSGREPAASALLIALGAGASFFLPDLSAWIDPMRRGLYWEKATELALIVGLFGTGLRIDRLVDWRGSHPTVRLLLVAMPICIAVVAGLGYFVAGMTVAGALLLGSVLAPTDPVLAGDVQIGPPQEGGEHPVRLTLTAEAGLNDGLAFPFVHLALAVGAAGTLTGDVFLHWLWLDVGYRIAVGLACGIAIGWVLGKILFEVPRPAPLASTQVGVVAIAGVMLCYGLTELAEGYGFIATFVAGVTLRRSEARHEFHRRLHGFTETIEHTLTALLLVSIGLALPALWPGAYWPHVAIGAALIFVIRPLSAWVALCGLGFAPRQRWVMSFYGVRGIGSIFYIAYAAAQVDLVNEEGLWSTVAITVMLSTLVHGLTAGLAVERATEEDAESLS